MQQTTILHHDNAPSHRAAVTQETGFELLEHPPYSLDLAPCDFFLFLLIKGALRGMRFEHVSDLTCVVQQEISEIPENFFRNALFLGHNVLESVLIIRAVILRGNDIVL